MSVWHLLLREIWYRKGNFTLALLSVVVAVGCLVAQLTRLQMFDERTETILTAKEAATKKELAQHEDETRKTMVKLGFHVLIVPKDQDRGQLYEQDFATAVMPEEYADRLAKSKIVTINHLLPIVQDMVKWPEQERTVVLIGTRGEVPLLHAADQKKPLVQPVPRGHVVLGAELGRSLKLKKGDKVAFQGRAVTVHKVHEERGTREDITVWMNLGEAQQLLKREGKINAILALECNCGADRLALVRKEIGEILPETQVIEQQSKALARAEQRQRAADHARSVLASEKAARTQLRGELSSFTNMLVPLVLLGCIVWLGVVTLSNIRERRIEIGIFAALGVSRRSLLTLFLARTILVGLLGAALGYAGGWLSGQVWAEDGAVPLVEPTLLIAVLVATPLLSAVVGALAALVAARQDPALILQQA